MDVERYEGTEILRPGNLPGANNGSPQAVPMSWPMMDEICRQCTKWSPRSISIGARNVLFGTDGSDGLHSRLVKDWRPESGDYILLPKFEVDKKHKHYLAIVWGSIPPQAMLDHPDMGPQFKKTEEDAKLLSLWCPAIRDVLEMIEDEGYLFDQLRLNPPQNLWLATARKKKTGERVIAAGCEDTLHAMYKLLDMILMGKEK